MKFLQPALRLASGKGERAPGRQEKMTGATIERLPAERRDIRQERAEQNFGFLLIEQF